MLLSHDIHTCSTVSVFVEPPDIPHIVKIKDRRVKQNDIIMKNFLWEFLVYLKVTDLGINSPNETIKLYNTCFVFVTHIQDLSSTQFTHCNNT